MLIAINIGDYSLGYELLFTCVFLLNFTATNIEKIDMNRTYLEKRGLSDKVFLSCGK